MTYFVIHLVELRGLIMKIQRGELIITPLNTYRDDGTKAVIPVSSTKVKKLIYTLNQSHLDSFADRFGPVGSIQFFQDVTNMGFHSIF